MRTFRLLGMAMIAIMVCVNFTACSSDDEIKDDDGVITSDKKLMQIKYSSDNTRDFSYDTKGRLSSIIHTEKYGSNTDRDITNYTWGNNIIMAEKEHGTKIYTLENALIRTIKSPNSGDLRNASVTYNSFNQLLTIEDISGDDIWASTLTWENEKIVKMVLTENRDNHEYTYTYSGKTCKGHYPLYWNLIGVSDSDDIFFAHPELIGSRISQLPDQMYSKTDSHETTEKYTYTLDKDGYMESCTMIQTQKRLDINETHTSTTIYTFKWE